MSLQVEVFAVEVKKWVMVGQIKPGERNGSLSHNERGKRVIYLFGCESDSCDCIIVESMEGIDVYDSVERVVLNPDPNKWRIVKMLSPGESHELTVKSDTDSEPRTIRFTNVHPMAS